MDFEEQRMTGCDGNVTGKLKISVFGIQINYKACS